MEPEVLRHRNAVFSIIYRRSLIIYKYYITVPIRWFLEINLLCGAFVMLMLWGYVHFTYIVSSEDCLLNVTERPLPPDVILQVEVYSNDSELWAVRDKAVEELYFKMYNRSCPADGSGRKMKLTREELVNKSCEANRFVNWTGAHYLCQFMVEVLYMSVEFLNAYDKGYSDKDHTLQSQEEVDEGVMQHDDDDVRHSQSTGVCSVKDIFWDGRDYSHDLNVPVQLVDMPRMKREEIKAALFNRKYTLFELFDYYELQAVSMDYTLLEFSQEAGYLSLSHYSRAKLKIPVEKLYIDPEQNSCFGGPFGKFLTKYFLGYDMMVIASFKELLPYDYGTGYIRNLMTGHNYYYKVQWMGKWRYGAGILPALFFTLVASVLLRQVHYHIFKFLTHFNHLLNQGVPMPIQTGAQIPFLVITYATIGLVIVMSEALSDDSVFSLLMVGTVWQVDQFYSIYCKHPTSKSFLPWFFFLYHFLPYAYYIRFNGQFWFIPFSFHWLMLQHAMLFFLHHYEIPALNHINPVHFRLPQRQNNPVPARPAQVDTSQLARDSFLQVNSTTQPIGVQAEVSDEQSQQTFPGSSRTQSDSSSSCDGECLDSDLQNRPNLQQTEDPHSSVGTHLGFGRVPSIPMQESELFPRQHSDVTSLRLTTRQRLQKSQSTLV